MRVLALDLGTSAVKLMRVDEEAAVLSVDRAPVPGIDLDAWIHILAANIEAHGDGSEIDALALTGQMHGLVTRVEGDRPGIAIPWHDTRAGSLVPALLEEIGPGAATTTGGPLAAGFLAASLAWVRENDPAHWGSIVAVSLPKDALVRKLAGAHVTDPTDAAGTGLFDVARGTWAWDIVDALGIPRGWLPRIIPSGSIAGTLASRAASRIGLRAGIPIVTAGGDAPVGAFGAGATREGDALVMLSTGAQVILPTASFTPDPDGRWYTWPSPAPVGSGYAPFLHVGTLLNGGNIMRWLDDTMPGSEPSAEPSRLLALPHLFGTRARPGQSAAIAGINETTTAAAIHRAFIESLGFSLRRTLDDMTAAGSFPRRFLLGGGLSGSPLHRQVLADVLGTDLQLVNQPDVTAYGAGLLAISALTGTLPAVSTISDTVTPNPEHARYYEALYPLYKELDDALTPISERLAAIASNRQP